MRKVFATIGGIAVAILLILGIEAMGRWLWPTALEIDVDDPETVAALIANMPLAAKMLVAFGWFFAAFAGGWIALRVCDWRPAGWIVAGVVAAGGIVNVVQLPHPLWMQVGAVLAPLLGGCLAQRLHRRPYPGEPLIG